ncbi:MAG TPA: FAD-binding protein [Longimicrobiales bacterium]|nr:FAD-binding protein [Longimicrobiales bacterium]
MSTPTLLQAHVVDTAQRTWTNKHHTYTQPLAGLFELWNPVEGGELERYNATTRTVQALLGQAIRDRVRFRAFGGGWSFTTAPATDGRLVNTKPLNLFFRLVPELLHAAYTGDAEGLRFAQCGCSILELNARLKAEGRSLRTVGASNGQTIVGAMATQTHGAAIDVGSIPDYVVGLHIVVAPDRHVWLERASAPVTADSFADRLGAELLRDDALFDAALVSFGSFGFIHGVMLETDPAFLLESHRRRFPYDAALRGAMDTLDFSGLPLPGGAERPYHFQVVLNPYDLDGGAFVTTMWKRDYIDEYTPPHTDADGFGPADDTLAFCGLLTDAVPATIPLLVTRILAARYRDETHTGTIGEIFTNTTTRGRAASAAIAIPVDRATEAVDMVLELNRREGPCAVLPACRYIRKSTAMLGWARFEPTCVLEIDGPLSARTQRLYGRIWEELAAAGIPHAFHWGKLLPEEPAAIRRAFGDTLDRWLAARAALLDTEARRAFSNTFLENLGLAEGLPPIV